jgi:hypothetical protein
VKARYEVVSCNGAGVHLPEHEFLADAQRHAERLAERSPILGPFEIQQVITLDSGGRRYFMREGTRWTLWDARRGADVRKPDWIWGSAPV